MFSIDYSKEFNLITLSGNLDSSRSEEAKVVFQDIHSSVGVDMTNLDFICSAGIGILVMMYSQVKASGGTVTLLNLKPHIKKVFEISLLDSVFEIE